MNEVSVTKKKRCYKVEYKGLIRYCPEEKIEKVKKELIQLNGVELTKIEVFI